MGKYIVLKTYTDSSYNEYHDTFVVDDRETAEKLADALLKAFVKTEMADGWEYIDLHKRGSFKTNNCKTVWNDKHTVEVEIQEAVSVSNFAIVEERDMFGHYYDVAVSA